MVFLRANGIVYPIEVGDTIQQNAILTTVSAIRPNPGLARHWAEGAIVRLLGRLAPRVRGDVRWYAWPYLICRSQPRPQVGRGSSPAAAVPSSLSMISAASRTSFAVHRAVQPRQKLSADQLARLAKKRSRRAKSCRRWPIATRRKNRPKVCRAPAAGRRWL